MDLRPGRSERRFEAYAISPAPPIACQNRRLPKQYVEALSDARTQPGEGRVPTRRGGRVRKNIFSIL